MKNYEFSIIKTWVIVSVILVLSSLLFPFIKKDYEEKIDEQRLTQPFLSIDKEIILLEKGNIDHRRYLIFEEKSTKARIFYYNGAMVLLPKK